KVQQFRQQLTAALREFHAAHPLAAGREMEELRARIPPSIAPKVFRALVDELEKAGVVARRGSLVSLAGHAVTLAAGEQAAADRIIDALSAAMLAPPDMKQLEELVGVDRKRLTEVLRVLERDRSIVRVTADLYFLADALDDLKRQVTQSLS